MKSVMAKLGNMRRAQDFTVYPNQDNNQIVIQSDKRIAAFDKFTGQGLLSDGKGGHQGFIKLSPVLGAKEITVSQEFIQECLKAQTPQGERISIGGGVYVG